MNSTGTNDKPPATAAVGRRRGSLRRHGCPFQGGCRRQPFSDSGKQWCGDGQYHPVVAAVVAGFFCDGNHNRSSLLHDDKRFVAYPAAKYNRKAGQGSKGTAGGTSANDESIPSHATTRTSTSASDPVYRGQRKLAKLQAHRRQLVEGNEFSTVMSPFPADGNRGQLKLAKLQAHRRRSTGSVITTTSPTANIADRG